MQSLNNLTSTDFSISSYKSYFMDSSINKTSNEALQKNNSALNSNKSSSPPSSIFQSSPLTQPPLSSSNAANDHASDTYKKVDSILTIFHRNVKSFPDFIAISIRTDQNTLDQAKEAVLKEALQQIRPGSSEIFKQVFDKYQIDNPEDQKEVIRLFRNANANAMQKQSPPTKENNKAFREIHQMSDKDWEIINTVFRTTDDNFSIREKEERRDQAKNRNIKSTPDFIDISIRTDQNTLDQAKEAVLKRELQQTRPGSSEIFKQVFDKYQIDNPEDQEEVIRLFRNADAMQKQSPPTKENNKAFREIHQMSDKDWETINTVFRATDDNFSVREKEERGNQAKKEILQQPNNLDHFELVFANNLEERAKAWLKQYKVTIKKEG